MYGTSEKLLDFKKRGFKSVKRIMIPEMQNTNRVKTDFFMIDPDGNFKKFWGMVLILLLLYTASVMPYRMALMADDDS